jgi:protein disulfide-isomerase A1
MLVHAAGAVNKFLFDSEEISVETISSFVNRYLEGKVEKYLKSEDAPATNDEPVKVIVGKTYKELVL